MRRRRVNGWIAGSAELCRKGVLRLRLTVHEIDVWGRPRRAGRVAVGAHMVEPLLELMPVPVRTVPTEYFDPCAERDVVAEHTQHRRVLHDPPAQGMFGLEPNDQDRVSWV